MACRSFLPAPSRSRMQPCDAHDLLQLSRSLYACSEVPQCFFGAARPHHPTRRRLKQHFGGLPAIPDPFTTAIIGAWRQPQRQRCSIVARQPAATYFRLPPTASPMAELYSGEFAFDDLDDAPPQQQRSQGLASSIDAATAAAAASPAPAPAAPPQSHHGAAAPGAPPPMLYIRSERLQQLSSGMSVNADRTELVHSLVESYALLEVR